jgi:tetratricopeptide (TPR) repeat protein/tRNA A-37 threonylcarbamoyl transferase component Bud32
MNQKNNDTPACADRSSAAQADILRRQFQAAWEKVPSGGARPQVEAFLVSVAEPERSLLQQDLEHIAETYQQDWTAHPSTANAEANTVPEEGAAPHRPVDMTVELEPHPELAVTREAANVHSEDDDPGFSLGGPAHPPGDGLVAGISEGSALLAVTQTRVGDVPPGAPPAAPGKRGPAPVARPTVPGYKLLEELGRGGMGVVYKARQLKLNRVVALKMVLAGAHADAHHLARFQSEAEAVAQLQHPAIVQIFEVGEHEGLPFFSLEFVDGGSLAQKIGGKPQPPREAAVILEQVATAMAAAHQRGIIHRDLKPANVLLTADGSPKVTDFGLAKRLEGASDLTRSGTLMGSPSYMAPEQARGEVHLIGPASDLYALGAVLYEQLTGRPPFVGTSVVETLYQVREQEPVPPSRLQPTVPRDLETICLKCLQKEPYKRYAGCEALTDDLHRFLSGLPIKARPVGRAERLWRWCRRNPRTAGLTGAVAVLCCCVAVSLLAFGVQLRRQGQAVAETRTTAGARLEQATAAVAIGNYRRAQDLLEGFDPLLATSAGLEDLRADWLRLKQQVGVYAEFSKLLDDARFACRFGSRSQKEQGRQYCRELIALYDQIAQGTGRAAAGLPPLDPEHQRLFQEDVFEAFLVASLVEQELAAGEGEPAHRQAARQAIDWLNRAEQVLPGTRVLYVNRASCWGKLGNQEADRADVERAKAIAPTSVVDHFWHGFAEHVRGDEALASGNAKEAQDSYRRELAEYAAVLQLRPEHFWANFNWAVCHARLGELGAAGGNDLYDALVGFTACIRLRSDFPWPYNNRGIVHLRLGEYEQAVRDCTAALEHNAQYAEAYANRGVAYRGQGKNDLALHDFDEAIRVKSDCAPAYLERAELYRALHRYPEAVRDYDRLVNLDTDKVKVYRKRAETYQQMNRGREAIEDYTKVVALRPRDAAAYFARGTLHYLRGDYALARDDYSQVIELAPKAADAYRNRAIVNWFHLKDFDKALADFDEVAKLLPREAEPYRCLGVIYLGRREYDRALRSLRQALDRQPGYPEAIWARAQVYLWQGKLQDALREINPVAEHLPAGMPETFNVRGDIYRALGRLREAAADYRAVIKRKPDDAAAYVGLALVLARQGRPDESAKCYDQMVAADPQSATKLLLRAAFRRDRREFDAGLADCDRAARREPKSVLPELARASIEAARGQHHEAVERAARALRHAPKNDGHVLYAAACVWSLASRAAAAAGSAADRDLARRYAGCGASFLAEALDKGFHDLIYPEHNRMADDPALEPIRQQPGVRDLLAHRP